MVPLLSLGFGWGSLSGVIRPGVKGKLCNNTGIITNLLYFKTIVYIISISKKGINQNEFFGKRFLENNGL